jgi:hypothetical protein
MTTLEEKLVRQIEGAVAEFITAGQAATQQAIARTFGQVSELPVATTTVKRRKLGKRRSADEVAQLSESLYRAIAARPGAAMTELAADVGQTPMTLQIAVAQLRRQKQIRSAGQRQFTRYFPLLSAS